MDASPVQRGGDHAAGLARALRILNRRPLSERLARRAVVIVISGGEAFPAANTQRALRLAELLKAEKGWHPMRKLVSEWRIIKRLKPQLQP